MEIRHLTSFVVLAEELHFTRAATKIHLTQSALSEQIRRLEQDVGVRLLDRTSRKVELTAAGSALLERARVILSDVEAARSAAQLAFAGRVGTITVGYTMLASQSVLPRALERMYVESPGIKIRLHELRTGPQIAGLLSGELDVALVFGRPTVAGLSAQRLHPVQIMGLVSAEDSLARHRLIRFADLVERPCVLPDRSQSPMMYDTIMNGAREAGVVLNVTMTADDPCATLAIVTARSAVGFTSATKNGQVRMAPGVGRTVAAAPVVEPTPSLDLHVVWRSAEENVAVHDFVRHLNGDAYHGDGPSSRSSTVRRSTQ